MSSSSRDRLVESAQSLLWERGYVGTSPRDIQERAGAGQGSMYHHFSGKLELAVAALERAVEKLRGPTDATLAGGGGALDRITAWLRQPREPLRGCPIGRMAQDPEVAAHPKLRAPVERALSSVRQRVSAILAEGRASGELDPNLDPDAGAAALVAIIQGGYVLARASGSEEPFHQAVEGALSLVGRASLGQRPPAGGEPRHSRGGTKDETHRDQRLRTDRQDLPARGPRPRRARDRRRQ